MDNVPQEIPESEEIVDVTPIKKAVMVLRPRGPNKKPWVPKEESPDHKAMYAFYASLGKGRSIDRVAKEFNRSRDVVGRVSKAFNWVKRIEQLDSMVTDPIASGVRPDVDRNRIGIVKVATEIVDILTRLVEISKIIKGNPGAKQKHELTDEARRLNDALDILGIQIKDAKSLRDLLGMMKDVMRFNQDLENQAGQVRRGGDKNTQVNIKEVKLVIRED